MTRPVTPQRVKHWWRCPLVPTHEWEDSLQSRLNGMDCHWCAGRRLTDAQVLEAARRAAAAGEPLTRGDAHPWIGFPISWPSLNTAWRHGHMGLTPHTTTLSGEAADTSHTINLSDGAILAAVKQYTTELGHWPKNTSTLSAEEQDASRYFGHACTWAKAERTIRIRHGRSWRQWLIETLALPLSAENVKLAGAAFVAKHGRIPVINSDDVAPEFGFTQYGKPRTWLLVDRWCIQTLGQSALSLLREVDLVGPRSIRLTLDEVQLAVLAWKETHGNWPTSASVPGTSLRGVEFTWTAIDLAMRKGSNGLPGGSSLKALRLVLDPTSGGADGRLLPKAP